MTPLRQVFHAGVVAGCLSLTSPTSAEPLAPIGPPTAADAAAAAAAVSAPPPALQAPSAPVRAPGKAPAWLASRPAPKAAVATSSSLPSLGRLVGLLLVVGSLGGAALYLKRRGASPVRGPLANKRLSVLSSTRIGPKAHAVVISVAGRQMLLGVTDASVKRLAFIDELEDDALEREPVRRQGLPAAARSTALAVRAAAPQPAPGRSFGELLKTAFKKREPEGEDAASILAAETQDVVGGKPVTSNVRMLDVEGQAQGLIRRLSGPRA